MKTRKTIFSSKGKLNVTSEFVLQKTIYLTKLNFVNVIMLENDKNEQFSQKYQIYQAS